MPVDLFSLDPPSTTLGRVALGVARPLLTKGLGVGELTRIYESLPGRDGESFFERALEGLNIVVTDDLVADTQAAASIPADRPLVVAANHPHAILDGLALAAVVRRLRTDARIVANRVLASIPELRDSCVFVDQFGAADAAARSLTGLRAAHLWLRRGGALIMFPAGSVAHIRDRCGRFVDDPWTTTLGRLAAGSGACVVPAFVTGADSLAFYAAGRLHPLRRTALLPRESLRKRGARISVTFGSAIAPGGHGSRESSVELTGRVRTSVDRLADASAARPCCHADRIPAEIAALPQAARLVEAGDFTVYTADAAEIPAVMIEIGRLRAEAYRAAGERSGTDLDLDEFDRSYLHLFTWDLRRRQIAGAYRIGRVDHIVCSHGVDGLYTRSLFEYDRAFIDRMPPSLELGRSFVRLEYQKHHQALLLLWRGIGEFVVRNPQYRMLFGPVSISARYCDASHARTAHAIS